MLIERSLVAILNIIQKLLLIFVLVLIFGFFKDYIANINSYSYLKPLVYLDHKFITIIQEYIPTRIAGRDFSYLIAIIVVLFITSLVSKVSAFIEDLREKKIIARELDEVKTKYTSEKQRNTIEDLEEKILKTSHKSKSREVLLKEFALIKKELEKNGRHLAFLSIDIVNSTSMKQQEDPLIIQRDFQEYRNFVIAQFKKYGYITASWTPDGVMACFNSIEQAIQAAKGIIEGLDWFNQKVKMIKSEFQVRAGVNSGFVVYDVTTPLEQFSDHIIDIAGHMQKNAKPNTILVAKDMVEPVKEKGGFIKSNKVIDSLEAYEWDPTLENKS